jgi:hypothetical protein
MVQTGLAAKEVQVGLNLNERQWMRDDGAEEALFWEKGTGLGEVAWLLLLFTYLNGLLRASNYQ